MAVFEGQLKRGPNPTDSYYDELAIPRVLPPGRHTLAVLVWYFGRHGFSHNSSGRCALLAELQLDDDRVLASSATWRAIRHPAYGPGGPPEPNHRLPESNVHFDARLEPQNWQQPEFDDSAWPNAVVVGSVPNTPWGHLHRRPIPHWRNEGLTPYAHAPTTPFVTNGTPVVCQLPGNLQVTPAMDLTAVAGLEVELRTDNYNGGGANNVRGTYVTRDGRQSYESLGWMNGHEVHYHLPPGIVVHSLSYRRTAYNTPWLGRFSCDNERLERLWRKSVHTLDVCMRDSYMDCPDRERAQWWGDVVIQAASAAYACDADTAPLLARKAIGELFGWQRADGTLYSPVPSGLPIAGMDENDGCWGAELPAQMLASIGLLGLWTYYLHTGDLQTIANVYGGVRRYLALWRIDPNSGLIAYRAGGWDWLDWGANVDPQPCLNAWYALALQGTRRLARALGRAADADADSAVLARLHRGFNRAFWSGDHYRGDHALPYPDDRAQALAVLAGFADDSKTNALLRVLSEQFHAGPYMEKYVAEALFQLSKPGLALRRLLGRYAEQLDASVATLWEGWSIRDATWGGGTYNHAWSAGAISLLQRYVAGIAPLAPGFLRFAVRPQPVSLRRLASVVPTPRGLIEMELDIDACRLALLVPDGTTAEVSHGSEAPTILQPGRHVLPFGQAPAARATATALAD